MTSNPHSASGASHDPRRRHPEPRHLTRRTVLRGGAIGGGALIAGGITGLSRTDLVRRARAQGAVASTGAGPNLVYLVDPYSVKQVSPDAGPFGTVLQERPVPYWQWPDIDPQRMEWAIGFGGGALPESGDIDALWNALVADLAVGSPSSLHQMRQVAERMTFDAQFVAPLLDVVLKPGVNGFHENVADFWFRSFVDWSRVLDDPTPQPSPAPTPPPTGTPPGPEEPVRVRLVRISDLGLTCSDNEGCDGVEVTPLLPCPGDQGIGVTGVEISLEIAVPVPPELREEFGDEVIAKVTLFITYVLVGGQVCAMVSGSVVIDDPREPEQLYPDVSYEIRCVLVCDGGAISAVLLFALSAALAKLAARFLQTLSRPVLGPVSRLLEQIIRQLLPPPVAPQP